MIDGHRDRRNCWVLDLSGSLQKYVKLAFSTILRAKSQPMTQSSIGIVALGNEMAVTESREFEWTIRPGKTGKLSMCLGPAGS
jgi:hypothetical protein